jgi:glyoxylase-like metal-dependent hydrolase (beta-lactamase superfamily II)
MVKKCGDFLSEYFKIQELEDGIFAAIAKEHTDTGSNAAIIDMGDYSVVFDTFLDIDAAADLRRACIELTGREAAFIINSHSHLDHIMGNGVFSGSSMIISSSSTRDIMATDGREIGDMQDEYRNGIKEIEEALKVETDRVRLLNMKNDLMYMKSLVKAGFKIRIPDITFDKELILHGTKRTMHIIACDIAHCMGNVTAFLPGDKVWLTGDLLFTGRHPWLGAGNPHNIIAELQKFMEIGVNYYVPGHGNVAANKDVLLEIQYIREIQGLIASKINDENPAFSVDELPEVFRDWDDLCFLRNISALMRKMQTCKNNES